MLTVIIPCYNYAQYLTECVESVRRQSYPAEIIVVDDGSTDDTLLRCQQLKVTFIHQPNKGEAAARNSGIRLASGPYIMCLDADDRLPVDSLSNFMRHAQVDRIVSLAVREFGDRSRVILPRLANFYTLYSENHIYHNAVFHKSAWEKVGGFDESSILRLGYEDWDFWLRLVSVGIKVHTLNDIGLEYRIHAGQQTKSSVDQNRDICAQYVRDKHKDKADLLMRNIL